MKKCGWNSLQAAPTAFSREKLKPYSRLKKIHGLALSVFASQIHLSQRERPWHNGKVSGFARGSPFEERLPPLRGKMSPQVTKGGVWICGAKTERARTLPKKAHPRTARRAVRGCCVMIYDTFTMRKVFPRLMQSSSRSYSAGTSPMTFTFSSAGRSVRMS